jgi:hypothetical protein
MISAVILSAVMLAQSKIAIEATSRLVGIAAGDGADFGRGLRIKRDSHGKSSEDDELHDGGQLRFNMGKYEFERMRIA